MIEKATGPNRHERRVAARTDRLRPRSMQIDRFVEHTGVSRTTTYKLHKLGKLKFIKIGRRSLVDMDSYEEMIAKEAAE